MTNSINGGGDNRLVCDATLSTTAEKDGLIIPTEFSSQFSDGIFNASVGADTNNSTTTVAAENEQTTEQQSFIHLLKGYVGPGCLSLPWAVSQLGIPLGCISCALVACWTSYNCWMVVEMKRYMQRETQSQSLSAAQSRQQQQQGQEGGGNAVSDGVEEGGRHAEVNNHCNLNLQISYAQVGGYICGKRIQELITACICVQQLAVCTVFLSFVGENLHAVLQHTEFADAIFASSHIGVITLCLPAVMLISCLPSLKALAPVIGTATTLLFTGFGLLGIIIMKSWSYRPNMENENDWDIHWSKLPIALCAILYSYEGICLILPVESVMKKPNYFFGIFVSAMTCACFIFATVSTICVLAFGNITNGSITAFLLQQYKHNENDEQREDILWLLLLANTVVSISVLLTYPLQLYPCIELMGPFVTRKLMQLSNLRTRYRYNGSPTNSALTTARSLDDGEHNETTISTNFAPLPTTENEISSSKNTADASSGRQKKHQGETEDVLSTVTSTTAATTQYNRQNSTNSTSSDITLAIILPQFTTPGDSPKLRIFLVLLTYVVAVAVPNVQALISLSGAVAGSSVALLFPPILQLNFLKKLEHRQMVAGNDTHYNSSTAPSFAKKRVEAYILLGIGVLFGVIGTSASIYDIVEIYLDE